MQELASNKSRFFSTGSKLKSVFVWYKKLFGLLLYLMNSLSSKCDNSHMG
jgi:hypothetical protein